METRIAARKARGRVQTGDTVLSAATVLNTTCVKRRLEAFADAHRRYGEAQRTVDEIETQLSAEQAQVARLDAEQDDAVEALAVCLAVNGYKRTNPFAGVNGAAPSRIKALPPAEKASAIHLLVATLQRSKLLPPAVGAAAGVAEQAAQKVEAALAAPEALRNRLRSAREQRDAIAPRWDTSLAALRHATRAAAAEAPGLYKALFGATHPKKKSPTPASTSAPPAPTEPPTPAATAS